MREKKMLNMIVILIIGMLSMSVYGESAVNYETKQVQTSGGLKTVKLVTADLNNPNIQVKTVYAKDKIGEVDSLRNIANQAATKDSKVVAAINGTFFDAYTDGQPVGNVQRNGEVKYVGDRGATIGFTEDNKVRVENVKYTIQGATNGDYGWPNNWFAWGINRHDDREDAVQILTSEFGKTTKVHNKLSVITRNNIIVDVKKGEAPIYSDGFTIVVGDKSLQDRFQKGDTIEYKIVYEDYLTNKEVEWGNVVHAIGAGPSLVRNGKSVYMPEKEGFKDPKILSHSSQRSFSGVTKDNKLMMGTVNGVTIKQLSKIAYDLGLVEAINLDGGASSGLIYKDEYKTATGREISNAIVITEGKVAQKPIKLMIDGKELVCTVKPIMKGNSVMVPMKTIFEAFDIQTSWDEQTKTIKGYKENLEIEIPIGKDARINGRVIALEVPAMSYQGATMIPIKLIRECLGVEVEWNSKERMVSISK